MISDCPLDGPALDDAALQQRYAYPDPLTSPWVRVNFVASLDGAVTVDGLSGGLGSPADRMVFGLLRRLADVILVGAGTVRAENYRGARRARIGAPDAGPPPIAVVTGRAELDPASVLFTDTAVAPIVLTTAAAPAARRAALAAAGGDVVVLDDLHPTALLAELARRGLDRVLCEGGPTLTGRLLAADAVDEVCLTVAPIAVGGTAGRIAHGLTADPRDFTLASVLHSAGNLLLRYRRAATNPGHVNPNG